MATPSDCTVTVCRHDPVSAVEGLVWGLGVGFEGLEFSKG